MDFSADARRGARCYYCAGGRTGSERSLATNSIWSSDSTRHGRVSYIFKRRLKKKLFGSSTVFDLEARNVKIVIVPDLKYVW